MEQGFALKPDQRRHEFEMQTAASADAVWDALTTPEGIIRWFTSEARVEPGPGGKLWLKWGDGLEGEHDIVAWEPGRKLALAWSGQSIVFEIENRGGTAVLRLVHAGFSAESRFDDEFEATFGGWSTYLAVLRHVLEHKAGQPVVNVTICRQFATRRDQLLPLLSGTDRILELPGKELVRPATGYVVWLVPALADSPVAVFCEAFGEKTYFTVSLYLFGHARGEAQGLRARIAERLDDLRTPA